MKFVAQPVNLEGNGGQALRVSIPLADAPPAGAVFAIWAARMPDALSPSQLVNLALGTFDLAAGDPVTQHGPLHGLRQAGALSVTYGADGTAVTLEGSLYNPLADMPPRYPGAPSWDVTVSPLLERSDGPWCLAVTALSGGQVTLALGGLAQQAGQEHLAGVTLYPSQLVIEVEIGVWLQETLRGLKPVLDSRMAAVQSGQDLTLKGVVFTNQELPDSWPYLMILPQSETDTPDGLSAPDRGEVRASYIIRGMSYGDDPALKVRALAQLMGAVKELLNTRKLRAAALPSGRRIDLARVTQMDFGLTEDTWDQAAELTWSCTLVNVGIF